jgi:FkbM family methyltransferase
MARRSLSTRGLARAAAALLPAQARARLAAYRFGYGQGRLDFDAAVSGTAAAPIVTISPDIRLTLTSECADDIAYHFGENGDSRDEMAAFVDASRRSAPGALLLDIGAHKGLFALVHCATAPGHRARLLEPSRSASAIAERLLAAHGFDGRSDVCLRGADAHAGTRHVVDGAEGFIHFSAPDAPAAYAVPFTTIDDECAHAGPPQLLKIDVEGAEGDVLRGARRVLADARPVVFLELHLDVLESRGESAEEVVEPLAAAGYRLATVSGSRLTPRAIARSLRAILRIVATPATPAIA